MTNRGGRQSLPGVCSGEIPALVLLNSREKGSVRFLVLGRSSGGGSRWLGCGGAGCPRWRRASARRSGVELWLWAALEGEGGGGVVCEGVGEVAGAR